MKKLLLTTALVACATTASANEGLGFFAGIYGGYTGSSTTVSATNGGAGAANFNAQNADLGGNGGQGGLLLGLNYMLDSGMVLGLDAFGQFGSHEAKVDRGMGAVQFNQRIKQKYAFGIAARLGYMFDTTHAYVKVGWINSRFEMQQARSVVNPAAPAGPLVTLTQQDNKNLNGLLLGVGADMPVGEAVSVGFSYDFSIYRNHTTAMANAANSLGQARFKPRTHAFNVVLKYKF